MEPDSRSFLVQGEAVLPCVPKPPRHCGGGGGEQFSRVRSLLHSAIAGNHLHEAGFN